MLLFIDLVVLNAVIDEWKWLQIDFIKKRKFEDSVIFLQGKKLWRQELSMLLQRRTMSLRPIDAMVLLSCVVVLSNQLLESSLAGEKALRMEKVDRCTCSPRVSMVVTA